MFRVPSSTPPSTPGYHRESRNAPSTTPAGPPPDHSLLPSSTPAGPPPAMNSLFGSSRPNFNKPNSYAFDTSAFGSSPPKNGVLEGIGSGSIGTSTSGRPTFQRGRTTSSGGIRRPSFSPDDALDRDAEGESNDDMEDDDEEDDDDEDDGMDEEEDSEEEEEQFSAQRRNKALSRLSQSVISKTSASEIDPGPVLVHSGAKQSQFDFLALAKGLAPNVDRATLRESDPMILETERLMEKAHASLDSDTPEKRTEVLGQVAQELVTVWQTSAKTASKSNLYSSRSGTTVGLSHANRLASLLLNLHHPSRLETSQRNFSLAFIPARSEARHFTSVPRVLLDWLNKTYSGDSEVELVLKEPQGYSKNASFWEAVHVTAVRGNFPQTIQLLQGAKLEVAETAQHDGLGNNGYTGSHLRFANDAVRSALELLHECPAVATGDWDIKGHDWNIFRQRCHQAYVDLQEFAEGESVSRQSVSQPFQAPHFGISQSQASFQLSVASRRAESKVPWSVYENLRKLYQLLLGNEEEILTISADWIEAALGLTIWWNGEEENIAQGSLAASRRSVMRSQRVRSVDVTPVKAYCQRMSAALAAVIENSDEDFSVSTTDHFEVGLACIMDDNVEAVLQIIQGWSLTVASAVAELASAGSWFTLANGLMDQFDQSDLMVLSYSEPQRTGVSKDDLQLAYSNLLATKGQLYSQDGRSSREGWEIAIQILGRLDDGITANERIEHVLNDLPLESAERVDKITQLCHKLGLSRYALTIAEKYADHLRTNTDSYGDTLMYYARAHDAQKIQEVLRVLVAHCLIKSTAYPPLAELDESLTSLIVSPKQTLTKLASLDPEAASLLSNHLSGYATIRKFYDVRDEEVLLKAGEKPAHRPLARKHAAANSLMVIIASAASSIRGGLYDPEVETAVQVDVLLPLLGEALIFVNQPKRTLTLRHLYDLLAAVEDLDTAPSMIRSQCEEVLSTTLHAAHDSNASQSRQLQKSASNLTTASSQYSLIGSADFSSRDGHSNDNSAILVKGGHVDASKRGWDWRKGFNKGAMGEDIIRILRLGITRELAQAFAEGEVTP